jgi:opine dehydrogenase
MKIALLGLGKIGHNTAATLVDRGFEVIGFTRDAEKARAVNEHGITVSGHLNGNFKVKATTDISEAVNGAKFLVVTTTSKGHKPMANLLKGKLQEGQRIVIITGNWGAYEFYSVLKDEAAAKRVIIGETSGNLAGSPTLTYPATTSMKPSKKSMSFATIPGAAAPGVVDELKQAFPEFYPVENVLDTSMNNTNPPVHVPFCIFNITRMANGEDSQFYGDCLPQILLDFTMAADAERCAVTQAIGGAPKSILELMNAAWNVEYDNIKDLGLNNVSLKTVKIPKTPYHRFLTEDVPFGFLPVSRLGKKYGVPTPRIDLMIEAYRYLLEDKAEMDGPTFDIDISEVL